MSTKISKENREIIRQYLRRMQETFTSAGITETFLDSDQGLIVHRYANGKEATVDADAILKEIGTQTTT